MPAAKAIAIAGTCGGISLVWPVFVLHTTVGLGLLSRCNFIRAKKRKGLGANIVLFFQDFFEMVWVGPLIKVLLRSRFVRQDIYRSIAVSDPIALQYYQVSNNNVTVFKNGIEHEVF